MKKNIIITAIALLGLTTSVTAFGASRASLYLVGQIEVICNLFVNPVIGTVDTLDIENGEISRLVATVDEETNNAAGYTIEIESVNTGTLLHSNGTNSVAYTIAYDGAAAVAPGAVGTPVLVKTEPGPFTGLTTNISNVEINVTAGGAGVPGGTYTDTLIFTMVAL